MAVYYIDTNFILSFLLNRNTKQFIESSNFFKQASLNNWMLVSSNVTIFEIYWVLISVYGLSVEQCCEKLFYLMQSGVINFEEQERLLQAIYFCRKNLSVGLEDSYHIIVANELSCDDIKSFDKKTHKHWLSSTR